MRHPDGSDTSGAYTPPPPYARPPEDRGPAAQPYGYPGYGYPPPYYPPVLPAPPPRLSFGVVAAGLTGLGAALLFTALLALPWFSLDGGLTTSDVRGRLDDVGDLANALSVEYFSWFGWVLLLVSTGCALTAAVPHAGLSLAFRIAGPIVAGFAVLFTLGSVELTDAAYGNNSYYFEHLDTGFWVAVVGFTCIGVGAIVGPRRHHDSAGQTRAGAGEIPLRPGTFEQ